MGSLKGSWLETRIWFQVIVDLKSALVIMHTIAFFHGAPSVQSTNNNRRQKKSVDVKSAGKKIHPPIKTQGLSVLIYC